MAQVPERCMQMLKQIITEIENRQNITREQLALLLETTDTGDIAFLHERARKTADAIYGKQVFIRGLIEFTNYCKNDCIYCGIRKSNRKAERYRLTEEEILSCCANGYELGFRTFVLQGGEDPYFTDDKICALIRQDPLADAWVEKGKMQRADGDEFSFEAFSLDATVFEDAGDYYYVWAEKVGVGKQISNLYIAKMESPCKLATVQVLLTTPDYDWERVGFWVNEGPAVIHHGDKLYLTYSASDTGVAYCVGMLTATSGTDLLDPLNWRKERHPVLQSSYEKGIYGPGHNSFTKDEDGNDIMVYHARTETEIEGNPIYNPNRHAHLMQVQWDENGKPVFAYD